MKCKICTHDSQQYREARILDKYDISYFRCSNCGFIQTEEAYWLDEAYHERITSSDIGLVGRNLQTANRTRSLISILFNPGKEFVDYGGGYGLYVRMMRDAGFDFYLTDKYSFNIFAKGFEIDKVLDNKYEMLTAFEVFEHFSDPMVEIEKLLSFSKNLFFSTNLTPQDSPPEDGWWYYGFEHGQHLSLYSRQSLQFIADQYGLNLLSNGRTLHLFTEKKISSILFRLTINSKISKIINWLFRRESLLPDDYYRITGKKLV